MSSVLEQLCRGERTEEEIQKHVETLRNNMVARSIVLNSLQVQQGEDKRELKVLTTALEDYSRSRKKVKRSQYIRLSIHTLEEVFAMLGQGKLTTEEGHTINTDSIRYQLFKEKGVRCVTCGLEGMYFAKEKDSKERAETYHFNLYGVKDGKEVLFTRDHIRPRSKGGLDILDNLQTMCSPCNSRKGSDWEEE